MSYINFEPEPGQKEASHTIPLPKVPLGLAVGLVIMVIALAASASLYGHGAVRTPPIQVQSQHSVRLVADPSGDVLVYDGATNVLTRRVPAEHSGFLRGLLRVIARRRMIAHAPEDAPITVVRGVDGTIELSDPSSGLEVPVTSFGPTQVETIASLLVPQAGLAAK